MAEILGVGMTHYPGMVFNGSLSGVLERTLQQAAVPAGVKDPNTWPAGMRAEWENKSAAEVEHRDRHLRAFRQIRTAIDEFNPDVVVIWGDDQYENFRETIVPPFCIHIFDEQACQPFHGARGEVGNVWGVASDTVVNLKGHRAAGKELTARLLDQGFDVSYSYKPSVPSGMAHAHLNTVVFLSVEEHSFPYPVIPVSVNCYGSSVIAHRGFVRYVTPEAEPDPPSPSPRRCFDLGGAMARALRDSPYRAVLIGSSSWSHAFLTDKNHWLHPDREADTALFEDLKAGRFDRWRDLTLDDIEESGLHEFLNWICLAGAMAELNYKPEIIDYVESYIFNSSKAFALFRP